MREHANTQTRKRISPQVRDYFSKIGKRGGRAGKGSPARAKAARRAALIRWGKHAELKQLEKNNA